MIALSPGGQVYLAFGAREPDEPVTPRPHGPCRATSQDRRGGESNQKQEAHKGNRAAICARGTAHRAAPRNALPRRGSPNSRPARLRLPQQKSRAWPDESYGKSGEDVETGGP